MTRFIMDLTGKYGEYWVNDAKKQIAKRVEEYNNGHLLIDENGVGRWATNGRVIPHDCAEQAYCGGLPIDIGATQRAENEEFKEFLKNYREPEYDAETLTEMENAFGKGTTVVNVFTGRRITL